MAKSKHVVDSRSGATAWRNRIVGHAEVPAGQLLANPANWRIHSAEQQAVMAGALGEIGWIQEVIVNKRTMASWGRDRNVQTMLDGHMRVSMAISEGDDTPVPVKFVDLDPAEEALALATFDPIGALAGRDTLKLTELVDSIPNTEIDLDALLRRDKKSTKGLQHTVKECKCCQHKCAPGCGCYTG